MAVVVQYVVVRDGVSEKMIFATKKEADAYDRLLDIADQMFQFLAGAGVALSEEERESLALYLAENREQAVSLLRGGRLTGKAGRGEKTPKTEKPEKAAGKAGKSGKAAAGRRSSPRLQEVAGGGK